MITRIRKSSQGTGGDNDDKDNGAGSSSSNDVRRESGHEEGEQPHPVAKAEGGLGEEDDDSDGPGGEGGITALFGEDDDDEFDGGGANGNEDGDDDRGISGLFGGQTSDEEEIPQHSNATQQKQNRKKKKKSKSGRRGRRKRREDKKRGSCSRTEDNKNKSSRRGDDDDDDGHDLGGNHDQSHNNHNHASSSERPYDWWGNAVLPQCESLPPEPQEGNMEYKLQLVGVSDDKFQHLMTQCQWRLAEGNGEAFYRLGVEDDGTPRGLTDAALEKSINTIKGVAARLRCDAKILEVKRGNRGKVALLQVRHFRDIKNCIDLRVCVCGEEGSGKSTLVGVLTSGELDDGSGKARMNVFRHRHEIQMGKTSSASVKLLGYDQKGRITNYQDFGGENSNFVEVSDKVITLIDLGGHERYWKTTLANLTGRRPDFAVIVIAANTGLREVTREHYTVIRALSIPIFIVMSKIDLASAEKVQSCLNEIEQLVQQPEMDGSVVVSPPEVIVMKKESNNNNNIHNNKTKNKGGNISRNDSDGKVTKDHDDGKKSGTGATSQEEEEEEEEEEGKGKKKQGVDDDDDRGEPKENTTAKKGNDGGDQQLAKFANEMGDKEEEEEEEEEGHLLSSPEKIIAQKVAERTLIPVFPVSCKTGEGLSMLKEFLRNLPKRGDVGESSSAPTEFAVTSKQMVNEVGLVMTGNVEQGVVHVGQELMLGPLLKCDYKRVVVNSIHTKRTSVKRCSAGVEASLSIKGGPSESEIHPGTVLLAPTVKRVAVWVFDAEIAPREGSDIHPKTEFIIHMGSIRQAARMISFESDGNIVQTASLSKGSSSSPRLQGKGSSTSSINNSSSTNHNATLENTPPNQQKAVELPLSSFIRSSSSRSPPPGDPSSSSLLKHHHPNNADDTTRTTTTTTSSSKQQLVNDEKYVTIRTPKVRMGKSPSTPDAAATPGRVEGSAGGEGVGGAFKFPRGRTRARFRFSLRPEYVKVNSIFVFRERRTKGKGQVISIEDAATKMSSSQGGPSATQSLRYTHGFMIRQSSGETPVHSPVLEPHSSDSIAAGDNDSPFPISSLNDLKEIPGLSLPRKERTKLPSGSGATVGFGSSERVARIFTSSTAKNKANSPNDKSLPLS